MHYFITQKLSSRQRVKDLTDKLQSSEMAKQRSLDKSSTVTLAAHARRGLTSTAMSPKQLKSEIKAIYKQLKGKEFEGSIHERNTQAVSTGGRRDVVNVYDDGVRGIMERIESEIEELSEEFEPDCDEEIIWKGITLKPEPRLWVTSYDGDDDTAFFKVASIEVVTGLNWQRSYKAMVNITLE